MHSLKTDTNKIWKYKETDIKQISSDLVKAACNLPVLARLLAIRGITDPIEAKSFLNLQDYIPTYGNIFADMKKAVDRVHRAIENQEHILVYGDFDVDGITGTSILVQALKTVNAKASYYIPNRHTEGHGLHSTALCRLVSSRQVKLVITTDTGITNFNEVNLLKNLNVDTIITDHHELPEHLPRALAIINPKMLPPDSPLYFMAGAGVAYKLAEELLNSYDIPSGNIYSLLDLVAVGTVVDMVPMLRENRYLTWKGLEIVSQKCRPGLKAILLEAGVNNNAPVTSQTLGFVIGPRLNAIGRIADANDAVELLTTTDENTAKQMASKLEQYNRTRKDMVEQSLLQAETHLINHGEIKDQKAIILSSPNWNKGIVGLVATRLTEKYNRPAFIGHVDDETDEVCFSARSIDGFNMHHNLMKLEDLFIKWGGHSGAAGFSIHKKDLHKLKSRLFKLCNERISDQQLNPVILLDMLLKPTQINSHLIDIINKMAPFGQDNPFPVFGLEQTSIGAHRLIGEDKRHLKLILTHPESSNYLEAIKWNYSEDIASINKQVTYRLAFNLELNSYNGAQKIQLLLRDFQNESSEIISNYDHMNFPASKHPDRISLLSQSDDSKSTDNKDNMSKWIDHRGRDDIEEFLGQILSLQGTPSEHSNYRIFCEGTKQFLPVPMIESLFCKRHSIANNDICKQLVLWDLPPDMPVLVKLLQTMQPEVIHLMGGKYHKIPLYRPPMDYLGGLYKVLENQRTQQSIIVDLSQLAITMSTTNNVVLSGLSLLNRLNIIAVTALPESGTFKVAWSGEPFSANVDLGSFVEFSTFQAALDEVHCFREWLMTTPIEEIQTSISLEIYSGMHMLKKERKPYVINRS